MGKIVSFKEFHERNDIPTLLTAYSYEDRIVESLKRITKLFAIKKAIIFVYDGEKYLCNEAIKKWQINREQMRRLLLSSGVIIEEVPCKHDQVIDIPAKICTAIAPDEKVIIDITGLTKNYIIKIAQTFDLRDTLFFYTRGGTYRRPTTEEIEVAVDKIIPIDGFEGDVDIDKNDLVVLALGYEGNRALSFLRKFETEPIYALIGSPYTENESINKEFIESAKMANKQLLNVHRVLCYEEPVHSLDPFLFVNDLEKAIKRHFNIEKYNVCLSCLGTKLQTLGLYLYWKRNPRSQILYSVPTKRFLIPLKTGDSWIVEFNR
jgi:hypothetical protein